MRMLVRSRGILMRATEMPSEDSPTRLVHVVAQAWRAWFLELTLLEKISVLPVFLFFTLIVAPLAWITRRFHHA